MKKLVLVILASAVIAGGFLLINRPPGGNNQEGNNEPDISNIISSDNQSLVSDHIRTATKKRTIDATNKQKVEISIDDFYFDATVLKIKNGTTVIWTNNGTMGHDVKTATNSPKRGPSSELLEPGETYQFTFDEPGLYLYFCSPHPTQMRAAIETVE